MKPNFALKLSNDGIELLHRASAGWLSVGSVSFADDDVARGCADLLARAASLEPDGIRTKLVLPDSETRYTSVVAPGPTDEARRYQIEAEIEALTPYAVDELAYDWSVEGDYALVVVCARETLAEAEGFADGYGFNPVSFVAAPDAGQFIGEPFFGQTSVAERYLPAGETVQREAEPVRVMGTAASPVASSGKAPAQANPARTATLGARAVNAPTTGAAPSPAQPPAKPLSSARNPETATLAQGGEMPPARRGMPALPAMPSEPLAKVGGLVRRMGTRLRREQAKEQAAATGASPTLTGTGGEQARSVPSPAAEPAAPVATAETARPEVSLAGSKAAQIAALSRPAQARAPDGAAAGTADEGPVAFASRRAGPSIASRNDLSPEDRNGPGGRLAVLPSASGTDDAGAAGFARRLFQGGRGVASRAWAAIGSSRPESSQKPTRRRPTGPEPIVPASRPPASEREKQSEAEALTIFCARGNQVARGSLGGVTLVAAGAALLLVVAVAVWTLYFSRTGETTQLAGLTDEGGGQVRAPSEEPIRAPATLAARDADNGQPVAGAVAEPGTGDAAPAGSARLARIVPPVETPIADVPGTDLAPEVEGVQTRADAAIGDPTVETPTNTDPDATAPERLIESLVAEALTDTPREAGTPAGTEEPVEPVAEAAPPPVQVPDAQVATRAPGGETLAAPQVANAGTAQRRLSLPSGIDVPPVQETAFTAPPPPPPAGTEFVFDDSGLVEATPEGALTPSGVTVFAGRPPLVPALRPLAAIPREALPPDFPRADPELADARPRPRSAAIAEAVRAFRAERGLSPDAPLLPAETDVQQDAALQPAILDAQIARSEVSGPEIAGPEVAGPEVARAESAPGVPGQIAVPAATAETQLAALIAPAPQSPAPQSPAPQSPASTPAAQAPGVPPPGGLSLAALSPAPDDPRPQQRPTDLVPLAAPAPPAAAPEAAETELTDAGAIEAADAPEIDLADATDEAVAASLQPRNRPSSVAERAQAALAEVAAVQVESDERQAEIRAAQPEIPSSASVARAATQNDAIRLNEINLIGVFGTADDRRALVRLGSGRVVRVQVGDRLDGGRVTAIGAAELRYTRNGRDQRLEIDG